MSVGPGTGPRHCAGGGGAVKNELPSRSLLASLCSLCRGALTMMTELMPPFATESGTKRGDHVAMLESAK